MKRGDKIEYTKTLAFNKGTETIKTRIVAIHNNMVLTEAGDTFHLINFTK